MYRTYLGEDVSIVTLSGSSRDRRKKLRELRRIHPNASISLHTHTSLVRVSATKAVMAEVANVPQTIVRIKGRQA
jgi:hypothetical protein